MIIILELSSLVDFGIHIFPTVTPNEIMYEDISITDVLHRSLASYFIPVKNGVYTINYDGECNKSIYKGAYMSVHKQAVPQSIQKLVQLSYKSLPIEFLLFSMDSTLMEMMWHNY